MTETNRTENDVVAELAAQAAVRPVPLIEGFDHVQGIATPPGTSFSVLDLEDKLPEPVRVRGAVILDDSVSLIAYVTRFKEGDRAALYGDVDSCTVKAVLNGPVDTETPGWGDHVATLALRKSIEWQRWTARDRDYLSQVDFAELVEEGIEDIIDPPAADMLELALTFQATSTAQFRQGTNLSSGERQFTFQETIDAKAGRTGEVVIPKEFFLRLRPFEGADHVEIRARLRYRLRDGRLTLGYFLDEPAEIIRSSFRTVLEEVAEAAGVDHFLGRPKP
jgi:uncharacterized protein YfdQ (DUF2303 family)